jgi:hypothetical protein
MVMPITYLKYLKSGVQRPLQNRAELKSYKSRKILNLEFMKMSSKVFQNIAIASIVLSFCLLAIWFSDYLHDYPSLNSELKPIGGSLAFLGMGLLAVAKRRKVKESNNN